MDQTNFDNPIRMARGSLLRIEDGSGMLVHVRHGEIWVTEEASSKDHVLGAGQSFRLERDGAALAYAFRGSLIELSAPALEIPASRIALSQAGAAGPVVLHRHGMLQSLSELIRLLVAPVRGAGM